MFRRIMALIICTVFVFQCVGLLLASEKTEEEKNEDNRQIYPEALKKQVNIEGGNKTEELTEDKKEAEKKELVNKDKDVVAIVNGEKIFRKALDRRLKTLKNLNQEISRTVEMTVVNQLTKKLLLKQFMNNQNIEVSDEEIKAEIEKVEFLLKSNPNTSEKSLQEILETRGSSMDVLREEIKETLALSKYLRNDVSDDAIENFFNTNKIFFNGEKVRVSHVLVDTRNLVTEDELKKAKQEIEDIKKEIDSGVDIAELAKKHSDCPSSNNGGDIGYFERRGSVMEPFAKVAFSLKVGEISDPVKTSYGYHIIKVTDRQKGKEVAYEDVKEVVEYVYMEIKTEDLVDSLAEKAEIEVLL